MASACITLSNGREYDVRWSEETLIPEGVRYPCYLKIETETPKGWVKVTGERLANQIYEQVVKEFF